MKKPLNKKKIKRIILFSVIALVFIGIINILVKEILSYEKKYFHKNNSVFHGTCHDDSYRYDSICR